MRFSWGNWFFRRVTIIDRLASPHRVSPYFLVELGLLGVGAFLSIVLWGPFLFPIGDDLECAGWPRGWAALYNVPCELWHTWGGCYSAAFFRALYAPLTRQGIFWTTPIVFVALHVIGGGVAFWLWRSGTTLTTMALGIIWGLIYFASMPAPAETTFWTTGMLVYETGNILAFILTLLSFGHPTGSQRNWLRNVLLWVLVPVVVGCHFTFALWAVAMLALRVYERGSKAGDVALFIWCLVFAGLVFAAPGNFQRFTVRMEDVATTVTVGYLVTRSVGSFFEFLVREFSLVQNWLWIILGAALTFRQVFSDHHRPTTMTLAVRLSAILLPLFGIFVLSAMTREVPPPARTLNSVHYLFIMGLALLVIPVAAKLPWLPDRCLNWSTEKGMFEKIAGLTLCFAIFSPNYVRCVRELITAAPEYKQYWHEVEKQVAEAKRKGLQRVEIAADPQRRPVTVFHPSFLGPYPQAWPNKDYAKFLGVAEVVAIEGERE